MVGAENKVEQVQYAAVMTRIEGDLDNELTGGWKFLEVSSSFVFCLLRVESDL